MRKVEPHLYKRGNIWWAYFNNKRWSLETSSKQAAERKLRDQIGLIVERRKTSGFVYFVRYGKSGPIKIGRAVNVRKRIVTMQTGAPRRLHLIAAIPGGPQLEKKLLEMFWRIRLRGEWFEPTEELLAFIERIKASGDLSAVESYVDPLAPPDSSTSVG